MSTSTEQETNDLLSTSMEMKTDLDDSENEFSSHLLIGRGFSRITRIAIFLVAAGCFCVVGLAVKQSTTISPSVSGEEVSHTLTSCESSNLDLTTPFSSRFSLENYKTPSQYNKTKIPTKNNPFVFFHQRKAGGSTMRSELYRAAAKIHVNGSTYIPCFKLQCETYYTPQHHGGNASVIYGGHLYYTAFMRTMFLQHSKIAEKTAVVAPPKPKFTCFTTFREPLSRIQSCWNYRMVQESVRKAPKLSLMTPQEIKSNLPAAMSKFGEGCLNEPMRIFSDYGTNEWTVNFLHEQPLAIVENAMNQTITRASQCIVGILERCHDTKKALQRHVPWFAPYLVCRDHLNTGKVEKGELNDNQTQVVEQLASYEIEMYKLANKILDAQIQD